MRKFTLIRRPMGKLTSLFMILTFGSGALAQGSPAKDNLYYSKEVKFSALKEQSLPKTLEIMTYRAIVRQGTSKKTQRLTTLRLGERVKIYKWVEGQMIENNCYKNPFHQCIQKTSVWGQLRYNNKDAFMSLVHFRWQGPSPDHVSNGEFNKTFHLTSLNDVIRSKDRWNVMRKQTADSFSPKTTSYLDQTGISGFLAKTVMHDHHLIASQTELRYLSRETFSVSGFHFRYAGLINKLPIRFRFNPPLQAIAVFPTQAKLIKIHTLSAKTTFREKESKINLSTPLRWKPGKIDLAGVKALILMTGRVAQGIEKLFYDGKIKVQTQTETVQKDEEQKTLEVKTWVDLNSDGQSEFLLYSHQVRSKPGKCLAYCDTDRLLYVNDLLLLYNGQWFETAYKFNGPDGYEGF